MKTPAALLLALAALLGWSVGVRGQGIPAGDAALAVPVSGRIVIVNEGPADSRLVAVLYVAGASTTQDYEIEMTLSVLGMPLRGNGSVHMGIRGTGVVVVADAHATGSAPSVTLHGPAGDATISLTVDQPMHGFASYDPAEAIIHVRGSGGSGMFEGVSLSGDLKSFFRPAGTLYVNYPSADAALAAVQRGLAQNSALTDQQRRDAMEQARQALTQAQPGAFPAESARQAIVSSTIQRAGAQTRVALRIVVPAGDSHQAVRVVSVGSDGTAREIYHSVHAPGETVSASVTDTPPLVVQVYVGGMLVKQITVPAP